MGTVSESFVEGIEMNCFRRMCTTKFRDWVKNKYNRNYEGNINTVRGELQYDGMVYGFGKNEKKLIKG